MLHREEADRNLTTSADEELGSTFGSQGVESEGYSRICFGSEKIARVLSLLFKLSGAEAVFFNVVLTRVLAAQEGGRS